MKDFVYKYEDSGVPLVDINTLCLYNFGEKLIRSRPHSHESWEIGYVMKGSGYCDFDGKIHDIHYGDLIFMMPGTLHHETHKNDENTEILFLLLNSSFIPYKAFDHVYSSSFVINSRNDPEIERILRHILIETFEHRSGFEQYIETEIARLLIHAYRLVTDPGIESIAARPLKRLIDLRKIKIVSEIKRYIDDNFLNAINIKDIASSFYISPQHLIRLFKDVTMQTPKEYLTELRIAKACDLLTNSSADISLIAEKLGYASVQHFCMSFKKKTRLTPVQFRKSGFNKTTGEISGSL